MPLTADDVLRQYAVDEKYELTYEECVAMEWEEFLKLFTRLFEKLLSDECEREKWLKGWGNYEPIVRATMVTPEGVSLIARLYFKSYKKAVRIAC